MKHTFSSEAIILGKRNYGEADQILTVFTKNFGKLSLLAKGIRKPKSRKRGSIEVFNRIKFLGVDTKALDLIAEVSLLDSFESLKTDLKKASVGYFFLEVVNKLTQEQQKVEELYNRLLEGLVELKTSTQTKKVKDAFLTDILVILGYWPSEKPLENPNKLLEEVAERQFSSSRVGKKVLE